MMKIQKNISLKSYNTFGFDVSVDFFVEIKKIEDLNKALDFAKSKKINLENILFLGGGSNILLTKNFKGLVIKNGMMGIFNISPPPAKLGTPLKLRGDADDFVLVKCNGGEVWDDFVAWTLEQNLFGLENLSFIPGVVGTCPIQNIGAYGVEVKDTIYEVEVLDLETQEIKILKNSECEFGYRDSIFKRNKKKYFIISVTFKLSKKFNPNLKYGIIISELEKKNKFKNKADVLERITAQDVRNIIIEIRESKLPDPEVLGNSGSFFKNPVVLEGVLRNIQKNFGDVPNFEVGGELKLGNHKGMPLQEKYFKIPAGWLIDKAGFKGKKMGNVGVHEKQALVLVNYGGGTGKEILELAKKIQGKVKDQFGIDLEMEVNVL